ncbi:hypothetical protein ACQKMD_10465 [Viridibacillus sp. NPDC096237]|uniref:hypothetical protein n=1 Tax=Viridibacillus sp. NPDC096237 TaxID=3390721 RepID=UPI003CFDA0C7
MADSAHEQVGLRFVMNELKNVGNPIELVNVCSQLKHLAYIFIPRCTGEVNSEKLVEMMPYGKDVSKLEKARYINEGQQLAKTKNVLHYLQDGIIISTDAHEETKKTRHFFHSFCSVGGLTSDIKRVYIKA